MIDRDQLEKYAHDALAHLYDVPYLQKHPLAKWLAPAGSSEAPGRILRRLLLEAIQGLKPPPDTPPDSQAASRYQFLYLRYVRGESIHQIAAALSLGERQIYRRQRDALEAIAAILSQMRQSAASSAATGQAPAASRRHTATSPDFAANQDVQVEVDRIGSAHPQAGADLAQVLRSALTTVGNLSQTDRQPFSLAVQPDLPPAAVDRVAIRQAILGLLVFAIGSGSTEIRVSAVRAVSEVQLRVQVRREVNPGAPWRLEEDSNLSVSRRLVELQGGTFTWQADGQVLEILVGLPVARSRTVLIVDDNQDTLQLFTRYLEERAHRVLTASTGEEALRAIAESPPDAVILDVMLPSADGWEVLQSVRSHPDTGHIPVIVCTVLKQRELALSLGAADFVPKPATQGALLAALDRCWSRTR